MGRICRALAAAVVVVGALAGSAEAASADDRIGTTMTAGAFVVATDSQRLPKVLTLSANLWKDIPGFPHVVGGETIEFWSGPHLLCRAVTYLGDPSLTEPDDGIASCRTPLTSVGTLHALVAGVEARFLGTAQLRPSSAHAVAIGSYAQRPWIFG